MQPAFEANCQTGELRANWAAFLKDRKVDRVQGLRKRKNWAGLAPLGLRILCDWFSTKISLLPELSSREQ
jgi:hypothetical protein